MKILLRSFLVGLCLWLMAWMDTTPVMAAGVTCEGWNTGVFFLSADAAAVSRCLKVKNPNARSQKGFTPLHWATAWSTTPAVVKALLDAGAELNVRGENGLIPLHMAAVSKNPAVVTALLEAGANLNAQNEEKLTPLHLAAAKSKTPAVVKALLDAGADPTAKDKWSKTPWDYAKNNAALKGTDAYWQLNEARFKTPNLRKRRGRRINAQLARARVSCKDWNTPKFFKRASMADIPRCLKAGAEVNARSKGGFTPLYWAAEKSKTPEVVRILLKAGATPTRRMIAERRPYTRQQGGTQPRQSLLPCCRRGPTPTRGINTDGHLCTGRRKAKPRWL